MRILDGKMNNTERAESITEALKKSRPNAKSELTHKNPLEFMVAVILSAQATDKSVNLATPSLFEKFKTAKDYGSASVDDVSAFIRSINFYKTKAERITKACQYLVANFNGKVPSDVSDLVKIPGIARKSANVISQEIFNVVEGIVVDTHVTRVSQRLKFTKEKTAEKIEKDLMNIVPKKFWKDFGVQIVLHGRYVCLAKNPKCLNCPVNKWCPSAKF
ncbi:endonuclease III [candidate division WWE3 bacterium CG10_big_fil_rev_8_21_14_0_10_39_14]|uniref:Endonuclease III n=2 Tax=Katanobacteria TaxID=422282 RepID=A0A2G9XCQ8_UNCKA|nr:MAG: endonuclease III [candidate division WWE3 bacterium CG23_combo_of_CG06-09_8_20_14_all_40_14]PJE51864.1 MAG: endonuclease III [candidate division WWE3 bacterium CG10_big_fil_rev_8_21_14_0_10_39_14]